MTLFKHTRLTSSTIGHLCALGSFLIWGVFPLYWKMLATVSPLEIICHRIIWSTFVLAPILLFRHLIFKPLWWKLFLDRKNFIYLSIGTICIALNWLLYIWAVNNNHLLQSSMGYFINPLLNVLIGLIVFKEKLRKLQWISVLLALLGVLNLTLMLGQFPWVALSIALTFAIYGALKKIQHINSLYGLTFEVCLLFIPASSYLLFIYQKNSLAFLHLTLLSDFLLVGSGLITVIPLLLFGMAAQKLSLTTVGFLQYISPTMQFLIAVLIFKEKFTNTHLLTFILIWLALIIYTLDGFISKKPVKKNLKKQT
ncbi:MAG: EamA family transporter RarD [Oligoflexia bacterium]|nr:EamA family transporter RarD [Oligoflexia bacterium]